MAITIMEGSKRMDFLNEFDTLFPCLIMIRPPKSSNVIHRFLYRKSEFKTRSFSKTKFILILLYHYRQCGSRQWRISPLPASGPYRLQQIPPWFEFELKQKDMHRFAA